MARRASSSLHPGIIIGGVIAIILVVVAGKSLVGKKSSPFSNVQKLDVSELLQDGNQLRGGEYLVEGKIDEKLRWTPTKGQIVSVRVDDDGHEEFVGIEIPAKFHNINIEREQRYAFRVEFQSGGIAVATDVTRL
ncbi:hypothetical protein JIN85_05175 [Luteolibacter pohnpeiensis]|uniref:Uncharacterized protein n=1 Tax=Luteolibacter pohnpeiensis TaxID=454153 RepID=A0A934VVS1_9BACT|nr:hypothetical protein [Luteolibacter pohnpeiensis]MBK1881794.1 hypothetical protein [Luteolibacter pohnpeiensis]